MRATVTGATGMIGRRLLAQLRGRGDEVTVLSRDAGRAVTPLDVEATAWDPLDGPAPAAALAGRDVVFNLMGEPIAQRFSAEAKRRIRESRVLGTENLVRGLSAAAPRPAVLVTMSAVGYYGPRGEERIEESAQPGEDFLAGVVRDWEAAAHGAAELGARVCALRAGVVLDARGGALAKMLTPFKLGLGGPIAGGRQYMPWIHADDLVAMLIAAADDERWSGAINACAPEPATNASFSKALGRALRRPAVLPIPGLALRLLYGELGDVMRTGQRAVPARALALGYEFLHPDLDEALRAALAYH